MKLRILTTGIISFLCSLTSNAQIKTGSWMLGGQANFNSRTGKADISNYSSRQKSTAGAFEISTGYAFKENQVVGIILSHATAKHTFSDQNSPMFYSKSKGNGIGAFYRLYHPLGNKFYVYGQASTLYNNNQMKSGITHQTSNEGRLAVSPGISYEVLKNVQIELTIPNILSLDYINTRQKVDGYGTNPGKKSFSANTSLGSGALGNLGIGFKVFI